MGSKELRINKIRKTQSCVVFLVLCALVISCRRDSSDYDATGVFESEEVIVSSEITGKILEYRVQEGASLIKDSMVARIDPAQYIIQSQQWEKSVEALYKKTNSPDPQLNILNAQEAVQMKQINVLQVQLEYATSEYKRIQELYNSKAATAKQLDDVRNQLDVLKKQLELAQSQVQLIQQQKKSYKDQVSIQNTGILSEKEVILMRKAAADDILSKSNVRSPMNGTVLTSYVHQGEVVTPGKPLFKMADLRELTLRAYVDGHQLPKLQLNQNVKVTIRYGDQDPKEYQGRLSWISEKSEFTPKTIQTADERANLVYAIKIVVPNDGYLKLGMYGEVKF